MRARNPRIGGRTVLEWSAALPPGTAILDLGCGHGVPIAQALFGAGFQVYGVDASPTLLSAFRERFPQASAECAAIEESSFFNRTFDAAIAVGVIFLQPADRQRTIIAQAARALNPGGRFLFTATKDPNTWSDSLTDRDSFSLGAEDYIRILRTEGFALEGHATDEGGNYYYFASKIA